ncbi:MAG: hypothetical protein HYV17_03395 [Xanthomonadales bacterium]|nr:hypothetical protein [Xanthomonadales bacterium]
MEVNPYQPPSAVVADPVVGDAGLIALREQHIRHEVQLKSVGALYFLGAVLLAVAALGMFGLMLGDASHGGDAGKLAIVGAVYLAFAAAALTMAIGFRRLRPWVRIPGGILSGLGLLAIPVGTLIHGWILYLMFGKQGRVVLAPEYQAVIDATPQVRYRRTLGDWIALGLVVALLLLLVLAIALPAFSR